MSYQVKSGGDEPPASCVRQTGHVPRLPDVKHTPEALAAAIVPAWTDVFINRFSRRWTTLPRLLLPLAILALFLASVSVAHGQVLTAPTVSTVAVTTDPRRRRHLRPGGQHRRRVDLQRGGDGHGDPLSPHRRRGPNRRADYHGTSSDNLKVTFRYTVLAGDDDDDGIAVVENSLTLNGGGIRNSADTADATLTHVALTTTDHKVDVVVTLLANFGQPASSTNITILETSHWVLEFTTGGNSGGYQLDSVILGH